MSARNHATRRSGINPRIAAFFAVSVLALSACGGGGGGTDIPQPDTGNGLVPAAAQASNGRLTLEQQDPTTSAGAQISTSPRFTLINEGVSQ